MRTRLSTGRLGQGIPLPGLCDELGPLDDKRAAVENLIKESNNDAGLTAHPSGIWAMNANHFQLSMLAYNLNCWLALFQREQDAKVEAADAVCSGADLAPWRADWDQLWESLSGARIV